jgi:TRAP-type uncharacterized transport system fused permease subunit
VLYLFKTSAGIWLLASGLEGYLVRVGTLNRIERGMLVAGGFLLAFPQWLATTSGLILCLAAVAANFTRKRFAFVTGKEARKADYTYTMEEGDK